MQEFISQDQARQIINELLPGVGPIEFIDHSQNNLIAKIDDQYIFRSPKSTEGLVRFDFEIQILQSLGERLGTPVPKLVKTSQDPPYLLANYLRGEHLENRSIRALGPYKQTEIGNQLAVFSYQLNQVLSPSGVKSARANSKLDQASPPWDKYFAQIFGVKQSNSKLDKLNKHYYELWQKINKRSNDEIVIHDDLHANNLLFNDDMLSGILDFEQINVGTIEQEFRNLYRLSEEILTPAAQKYQDLTGNDVDLQAVRIWAITVELAALSRQIIKEDTNHWSYPRALLKLRYWLPDFPL